MPHMMDLGAYFPAARAFTHASSSGPDLPLQGSAVIIALLCLSQRARASPWAVPQSSFMLVYCVFFCWHDFNASPASPAHIFLIRIASSQRACIDGGTMLQSSGCAHAAHAAAQRAVPAAALMNVRAKTPTII
jgi:hypothetical protein